MVALPRNLEDRIKVILAALAVGICLCSGIELAIFGNPFDSGGGQASDPGATTSPAAPGTTIAPGGAVAPGGEEAIGPFRQSVLAEAAREPTWLAQVSSVRWGADGQLVAQTTIPGQSGDVSAVRDMCVRLSLYVGLSGRTWHGVVVRGADGRPLARRDAPTAPCTLLFE
jgi:hypothetical protein